MAKTSEREAWIDDKDYLDCQPRLYRMKHVKWKELMLSVIDNVVEDLEKGSPIEEVMERWELTARDVALLVRLKFVTEEEAARFDMNRIEATVPY